VKKFVAVAVLFFPIAILSADYGSVILSKEDVLSVSDGHTFRVDIQQWQAVVGENVPVRLRGIDTPMIEGECEQESSLAVDARNFVHKMLISAETIVLHDIDRDARAFRLIADVEVDGVDLGSALIDAELGRTFDGETQQIWCDASVITIAYQGGAYSGELADNLPNGEGAWTKEDGQQYIGQWKNGLWHGEGTYTGVDGSVNAGDYRAGKRNGQSAWTHPDGRKYVGEFRDNQMHGSGVHVFSNGDTYAGVFENGKQHGQGTYTFTDGSMVVGDWKAGKPWQSRYTNAVGQEIGQYNEGVWQAN